MSTRTSPSLDLASRVGHVARICATALSLAISSPAHADAPDDASTERELRLRAVMLGQEAKAAFDAGDYHGALVLFERAEAAYHSPVFLLHAARCQRALARPAEARALFRRVIDAPLPENAPTSWVAAVASAERELAALEPPADEATVVPVLPPDEPPPPPLAPAEPAGGLDVPATVGWTLMGLGAVTLAAGIGVGVMALDAESEAKETCHPRTGICPDGDSTLRARALRYETLAIGLDVIGGLGIASGLTLVLLGVLGEPAGDLTLTLTPTGAGLRARL
jgi:hypothetical protein